jgi:glutamate synthase (NADPH) large chain
LGEIVGRTDLLQRAQGVTTKQQRLDLAPLLEPFSRPHSANAKCPGTIAVSGSDRTLTRPCGTPSPDGRGEELAARIEQDTEAAVTLRQSAHFHFSIANTDRTIGARLAGAIARRYGDAGLGDALLTLEFDGSAGQSFGAWNTTGMQLVLHGEANDGVGKGMAGGRIVVRPPPGARFATQDTVIVGNTCLYGATGGELFAAGRAGERFGVRNSGALAVVEGVGDHGCEYMTGGTIVVLGRTGLNFGAGMTGGFAYVLDLEREFVDRYNHELVDIHRISLEGMENHLQHLRALLRNHADATQSAWAQRLLADFRDVLHKFWLVKPKAASLEALTEELKRAA